MIHFLRGDGGGWDARDGSGDEVAVQLCRPGGARPGGSSAAHYQTGGEQRAGEPGWRARRPLRRPWPALDPARAADPGEPVADPLLGAVRAAADGADGL